MPVRTWTSAVATARRRHSRDVSTNIGGNLVCPERSLEADPNDYEFDTPPPGSHDARADGVLDSGRIPKPMISTNMYHHITS